MREITEIIVNLAVTAFAIYGIYVLVKWKKAAQKVNELYDEMHQELSEGGTKQ